jgi:hypothetical protein
MNEDDLADQTATVGGQADSEQANRENRQSDLLEVVEKPPGNGDAEDLMVRVMLEDLMVRVMLEDLMVRVMLEDLMVRVMLENLIVRE